MVHLLVFPGGIGLPHFLSGSAHGTCSRNTTSMQAFIFRAAGTSLMFRPPSLLAPQVVPTVGCFFYPRPPWLVRPRISRFVTSPNSGYANRPNRAIDGRGTFTLQDLRPCWPLLGMVKGLLSWTEKYQRSCCCRLCLSAVYKWWEDAANFFYWFWP